MAKTKVDRADQDPNAPETGGTEKVKRERKSPEERFEFFTNRVKRLTLREKSVLAKMLKEDLEKNLDAELQKLEEQRAALLEAKNA